MWIQVYGYCLLIFAAMPSSTLCRVFPSHYAFRDDVIRSENDTNVCTNYDENPALIAFNINTSQYVKCSGDIRLSDSDYGPQQYSDSDQDRFYIWKRADNSRLLFTFPSTVQLTYITLHYYSDSCASLPMIIFYEVESEWKIWRNIPSSSIRLGSVDFTQPTELGELKSVTHDITGFNSNQLLMVVSTFSVQDQFFLLSEVEFFNESAIPETPVTSIQDLELNPNEELTIIIEKPTSGCKTIDPTAKTTTCNILLDKPKQNCPDQDPTSSTITTEPTTTNTTTSSTIDIKTTTTVTVKPSTNTPGALDVSDNDNIIIAVVMIGVLALLVMTLLIIIGVILLARRRRRKEGKKGYNVNIDPEGSSWTGETNLQVGNITGSGSNDSGIDLLRTPTHTANMAERSSNSSVELSANDTDHHQSPENAENKANSSHSNQNTSRGAMANENTYVTSPLPPHTVEDMYSVVKKKPKPKKGNADLPDEDEDAPPIPPHTEDKMYTVNLVQKTAKNTDNETTLKDVNDEDMCTVHRV